MVACQGLEGRRNAERLLAECVWVCLWGWWKYLEVDRSGGCIQLWMCSMLLSCSLDNGQFLHYVNFTSPKRNKQERIPPDRKRMRYRAECQQNRGSDSFAMSHAASGDQEARWGRCHVRGGCALSALQLPGCKWATPLCWKSMTLAKAQLEM